MIADAINICHCTSAHHRYDTRIFLKECRSLSNEGYQVAFVVADGKGDEIKDNVYIHDVGLAKGRIDRIVKISRKVFEKARALNAQIYHFHDPELIPAGLRLKRMGKIVIFDSHEDYPKQIQSKPYIHPFLRLTLSYVFSIFEKWACKRFDAIVAATLSIKKNFLFINKNTIVVNNYPILYEFFPNSDDWEKKELRICYVGGIATVRGIQELIKAMEHVNSGIRLLLAGSFNETNVEKKVKGYNGWERVDYEGFVDRAGVRHIFNRSIVGIVTLWPIPNYLDSMPIKMFEYMSSGLPVVASNFPLWREIIEGNQCGICVDPLAPGAISEAINYIVENPEQAEKMGYNGRRAVANRYNWQLEEKKLFDLYSSFG